MGPWDKYGQAWQLYVASLWVQGHGEGEEGEKEAVSSVAPSNDARSLSNETGSAQRFSAVYWTPN